MGEGGKVRLTLSDFKNYPKHAYFYSISKKYYIV